MRPLPVTVAVFDKKKQMPFWIKTVIDAKTVKYPFTIFLSGI